MRTIDDMRTRPTWEERHRFNAFAHRLGRLTIDMPPVQPEALMSYAVRVAKTWRTCLAWYLANALGWRTPEPNPRADLAIGHRRARVCRRRLATRRR